MLENVICIDLQQHTGLLGNGRDAEGGVLGGEGRREKYRGSQGNTGV